MTAVLRNRRLTFVVACCAALVALAAGCGGGGSSSGVPKGDVAVVNGQQITEAELQSLVDQSIESFKVNKQPVPKPGSAQYKALQQRLVQYLVQKAEFEQEAKREHVTVKPSEIDAEKTRFIKQYFAGSDKKYRAALKKQRVTDAQVRQNVAFTVLQNDLIKKATAGITVSEDEARNYYLAHAPDYSKPQTREVEHIVVKKKALAQKIYNQLKNGADFAKLATKYSIDSGSKARGGKLGPVIKGGGYDPTFEQTVFSPDLKTGEISKPVNLKQTSQPVWDVIKALGDIKPRQVIPFSKEKASITQQLLNAKKTNAVSAFQTRLTKFYSTRIKYAKAFAPPSTSPVPTTTTSIIPTVTVPTG